MQPDRTALVFLVWMGVTAGVAACRAQTPRPPLEAYAAHTFEGPGGTLPYRLLIPNGPRPEAGWPLIVFLHGAGERGSDNVKQLRHGGGFWPSPELGGKHPAIVLLPQCPEGRRWTTFPLTGLGDKTPRATQYGDSTTGPMRSVMALIDSMLEVQGVDPGRLYVVGLSMGGAGALELATQEPQVAAVVSMAGDGPAPALAQSLKRTAVWLFHGDADQIVPPRGSREIAAALKRAQPPARFTEIPGVAHSIWDQLFQQTDWLDWLMAQKRQPNFR